MTTYVFTTVPMPVEPDVNWTPARFTYIRNASSIRVVKDAMRRRFMKAFGCVHWEGNFLFTGSRSTSFQATAIGVIWTVADGLPLIIRDDKVQGYLSQVGLECSGKNDQFTLTSDE